MQTDLNIIGIIPARYGSTRLPVKPLIDLGGKPIIQHVFEHSKQSTFVKRIIVATDHDSIVEAVRRFGGEVVLTPENLHSGSDRIAYVAKELIHADIIVNIQGDEPLISPKSIDAAVKLLLDDPFLSVGTVVKKISSHDELANPNIVKVVLDLHGNAIYFSRAPIPHARNGLEMDQWPTIHQYYKHIGLYVFRRDFLIAFASWPESSLERIEKLEQLRIIEHGYRIKATITELDSTPVDTLEDLERAQIILQKQSSVNAT